MSELANAVTGFLAVIYYWIESIVLFFIPIRLKAKDISEDLVLVTGAGSGLGRCTALKFAEKGCNMVLWDVNAKGNEETAAMIREKGVKAYSYEVDVTNSEAVYSTAAKVKQDAGIVTIVINNAGIVIGNSILNLEEKSIRRVFEVNILAHFWVIKAFLPDILEKDRGHFVTISSMAGLAGIPKLSDYCATKYAACGLLESLLLELHADRRKNIYTTIICPSFINTGLFDGAKSRFFSNLEPDYVAEEVVNSVICNKYLVLIPRFFHTIYILKMLMPLRSILALQDTIGSTNAMATFTGRYSKKIQ